MEAKCSVNASLLTLDQQKICSRTSRQSSSSGVALNLYTLLQLKPLCAGLTAHQRTRRKAKQSAALTVTVADVGDSYSKNSGWLPVSAPKCFENHTIMWYKNEKICIFGFGFLKVMGGSVRQEISIHHYFLMRAVMAASFRLNGLLANRALQN